MRVAVACRFARNRTPVCLAHLLALCVSLNVVCATLTPPSNARPARAADCRVRCRNARGRPVCGTDGVTYPTACEVRRLSRCEGSDVSVAHRGQCDGDGSPDTSNCPERRRVALEQLVRNDSREHIPACKADGTFAEVQCHRVYGNCWCVQPDGKLIPDSSVDGTAIKCRSRKVKKHRRRAKGRKAKKSRGRRRCRKADKVTFSDNMVKLFSEDYARIPKPTTPRYPGAPTDLPIRSGASSLLDTHEKRVIEWKFSELDMNKNNELERSEIRLLRRMVKKMAKPIACAKKFHKYCDVDNDKRIARKEWSTCLGIDANENHDTGKRIKPSVRLTTQSKSRRTSSTADDNSQVPTSCSDERRAAQADARKNPSGGIFIPVCLSEKLYRAEQCQLARDICWCVDKVTGKPLRSSAPSQELLNCTLSKQKTFKGCLYPQRKTFLTEIMDRITTEMMEYATNATSSRHMPEPDPRHSIEERAVRWKFHNLDKNKNSRLERKEVRSLKKTFTRKGPLRKCGRNFLRYCDENTNKYISMEEWIDCMGINEKTPARGVKRRGPNPLNQYLKS